MSEERQSSPDEANSEEESVVPLSADAEPPTGEPADLLTEILEDAPPGVRRGVRRSISMRSMAISGPMPNPLLEKFNEEHIHKILEYSEAESRRNDQQTYSGRKFTFAFFLSGLIAIIGILLFLVWRYERDLAVQVFIAVGAFGGGYGVAQLRDR